ncbi:YggT family protein [uncultured Desulfuromonas sp.]|uniref:YggT family protein n=1 Tax=uncultured Desulfuromonas sp. TaxID=181013 RepID=UPI002AAAD581|nr:YggT family protein [uncultured Desulfuromonas sp.]
MILRELFLAIAGLVDLVFSIYVLILVGRALISWVNPDPYNPIVRFLHSATDPVLYRIQRLVPLQFGGIDFSPLVLLLALSFVQRILVVVLRSIAYSF